MPGRHPGPLMRRRVLREASATFSEERRIFARIALAHCPSGRSPRI